MAKEEPKPIEFDKCPVCKSDKRYCADLAMKEKACGHMRREINFHFRIEQGAVLDQELIQKLPVGTSFPVYKIYTDICPDCGTIYVVRIEEGIGTKKPQIALPGQKGFNMPPFPGTSNLQGN